MRTRTWIHAWAWLLALLLPLAAHAGDGSLAPVSVTEGGSRVVALTAGYSHTCVLKVNGSAACWGRNDRSQAPSSVAGPFIALASGDYHTCGLKADGSAVCWGNNLVLHGLPGKAALIFRKK